MSFIKSEECDGHTIDIHTDEDALDPRQDGIGTVIAFGRKKFFGDVHPFEGMNDARKFFKRENAVFLPVYLYDHSVQVLSTESFIGRAQHAEWDSYQLGFIYCLPEVARKELNVGRLTAKHREQVKQQLINEIDLYSKYINGEVFSYVVMDENANVLDACGGFYSIEDALHDAKEFIGVDTEPANDPSIERAS